MFDYWKQFVRSLSLEGLMAAVGNEAQPRGPADKTLAVRLASQELLQQRVPSAEVAAAVWQLASHFPEGGSHDQGLVAALYLLQARPVPEPRLDPIRLEAGLLAQRWMTEGHASIAVVTRFEESLYRQFS